MIDIAIEELTRLLIKQDFKDKKSNKEEYVKIKKTELIKLCIKLLKLIERSG